MFSCFTTFLSHFPWHRGVHELDEPEEIILCDLAALQFQQKYNAGQRLVIISDDERYVTDNDKALFKELVGEDKVSYETAAKNKSRYIPIVNPRTKKTEYFDTIAYRRIVANDVVTAAYAICDRSKQGNTNFKFLSYGTGAFAKYHGDNDASQWPIGLYVEPVKAHILQGVYNGLKHFFENYNHQKITCVELPYYPENAEMQKKIQDLCKKYGKECIFGKRDFMQKDEKYQTGVTTCGDPHAPVGNEMHRLSVDATAGENLVNKGYDFAPKDNTSMTEEYVNIPAIKISQAEKEALIKFQKEAEIKELLSEKIGIKFEKTDSSLKLDGDLTITIVGNKDSKEIDNIQSWLTSQNISVLGFEKFTPKAVGMRGAKITINKDKVETFIRKLEDYEKPTVKDDKTIAKLAFEKICYETIDFETLKNRTVILQNGDIRIYDMPSKSFIALANWLHKQNIEYSHNTDNNKITIESEDSDKLFNALIDYKPHITFSLSESLSKDNYVYLKFNRQFIGGYPEQAQDASRFNELYKDFLPNLDQNAKVKSYEQKAGIRSRNNNVCYDEKFDYICLPRQMTDGTKPFEKFREHYNKLAKEEGWEPLYDTVNIADLLFEKRTKTYGKNRDKVIVKNGDLHITSATPDQFNAVRRWLQNTAKIPFVADKTNKTFVIKNKNINSFADKLQRYVNPRMEIPFEASKANNDIIYFKFNTKAKAKAFLNFHKKTKCFPDDIEKYVGREYMRSHPMIAQDKMSGKFIIRMPSGKWGKNNFPYTKFVKYYNALAKKNGWQSRLPSNPNSIPKEPSIYEKPKNIDPSVRGSQYYGFVAHLNPNYNDIQESQQYTKALDNIGGTYIMSLLKGGELKRNNPYAYKLMYDVANKVKTEENFLDKPKNQIQFLDNETIYRLAEKPLTLEHTQNKSRFKCFNVKIEDYLAANKTGKIAAGGAANAKGPLGSTGTLNDYYEEGMATPTDLAHKTPEYYQNDWERGINGLAKTGGSFRVEAQNYGYDKARNLEAKGRPYTAIFIAAPNFAYSDEVGKLKAFSKTPEGREQYKLRMASDIRQFCRHAIDDDCDSIALAAHGCGLFYNNPFLVAAIFRVVLDEPEFKQLTSGGFIIYDNSSKKALITQFNNVLSCDKEKLQAIIDHAPVVDVARTHATKAINPIISVDKYVQVIQPKKAATVTSGEKKSARRETSYHPTITTTTTRPKEIPDYNKLLIIVTKLREDIHKRHKRTKNPKVIGKIEALDALKNWMNKHKDCSKQTVLAVLYRVSGIQTWYPKTLMKTTLFTVSPPTPTSRDKLEELLGAKNIKSDTVNMKSATQAAKSLFHKDNEDFLVDNNIIGDDNNFEAFMKFVHGGGPAKAGEQLPRALQSQPKK